MWLTWLWLLAVCLQLGLAARQLHCVALLSDLETDMQNPHDWAREMNRFRVRVDGGRGRGGEECQQGRPRNEKGGARPRARACLFFWGVSAPTDRRRF